MPERGNSVLLIDRNGHYQKRVFADAGIALIIKAIQSTDERVEELQIDCLSEDGEPFQIEASEVLVEFRDFSRIVNRMVIGDIEF